MCTASLDRSVRLWDIRKLPSKYSQYQHSLVKDAECSSYLHEYTHSLSVNSAFFNQTGDMIVTTCQDNHLRVFNTITNQEEEHCVSIQHRNQTGKWLTKLMAEWVMEPTMPSKEAVQYFHCGSMDEPRQVNVVVIILLSLALFGGSCEWESACC